MFAQKRFLVESTHTDIAFVPEVGVRLHVLRQMRNLNEFLIALATLKWEHTVGFHVLREMWLLFKCFVRTLRTCKTTDSAVNEQMLVEGSDLSEFLWTLIANVLLDLVVGFHVIVKVGDLFEKIIYITNIFLIITQKKPTWAKARPHVISTQTNGRSPVWSLRWLFKFVTWVNALPHSPHTNGLSFRWIRSWFRKFAACVKPTNRNNQFKYILNIKTDNIYTFLTKRTNELPVNGVISHVRQ